MISDLYGYFMTKFHFWDNKIFIVIIFINFTYQATL